MCIAHILVFFFRSDAVGIKYEKERGRYAVAARDIAIGELIAVETAFVALLDKASRLQKKQFLKILLRKFFIKFQNGTQNLFYL